MTSPDLMDIEPYGVGTTTSLEIVPLTKDTSSNKDTEWAAMRNASIHINGTSWDLQVM